ncbi:MAG: hypothetical protein PHT80_12070, partial [Lentisphaeria bacterium]|nr:hypothetical protein [Lentisphaeria bacterium]
MKKQWGIWDWVYVIWTLVVCLLAMWACDVAAGEIALRDALNDFRQDMTHMPGRGVGRGGEQLREERVGNAVELTSACMEHLTRQGYDCQVVFGRVVLSPAQAAAWAVLPREGIQWGLGDESHPVVRTEDGLSVDMPWLQVLSHDLWGFGVADDTAAIWVNVFPALIAHDCAPSVECDAIIAAATRLMQGVGAITTLDYGIGGIEVALGIQRFPATMVTEKLAQCLAVDNAAASHTMLTAATSLPGYRGVSCLSPAPVAILEEYGRYAIMPPELRACVVFRLLADGEELLRWQCPQEEIGTQTFALQWRDDCAEPSEAATRDEFRDASQPLLSMDGHVVAEGKVLSDGDVLTLVCCRYAEAAATTLSDQVSFAIEPRRECRWVVSSGTMAPPEPDGDADAVAQQLRRCAYLQDCQRRIAAAELGWQDCAWLRVLLLQRNDATPVATADDDVIAAVTASSWRLVLPEEEPVAYASTAAGVNPDACRRPWSMAMAFAPMLALEWLATTSDGITITSSLNAIRNAFQRQSQWLWLPKDFGAVANSEDMIAPWLPMTAAAPRTEWLGAGAMGGETPVPVCSWPEAQNSCQLHIMASTGEVVSPAAVVSLDDVCGDDSNAAALDFFCRAYQRVLALIRNVAEVQCENVPQCLKDLTAMALLVGLTDEAGALPRIDSITVPACWSSASGECPIRLQLAQTTWWSLCIENAVGEPQWQQRGTACTAELRWPLHDLRQHPCADGSFVLRLRVGDGQHVEEQYRCVVLDSQAPRLRLVPLGDMSLPGVRYSVNDASPATAELVLTDDAGTVIRRWDALQANAPAELFIDSADLSAGNYLLTLYAEDAAGNRAREELALDLLRGPGILPELRLRIVGHEAFEPVLTTDTRLEVYAKGIDDVQECALFLDGDILLATGPGPLLAETLYVSQWPAGRHVLQAVAWDEAGDEYLSASIACYIRPEKGDDELPPMLDVALDGWPPDANSTLAVSAWDNRDLQCLRVWLDGELMCDESFSPGTQEGRLENLPMPASALARGLWLQASDRAGNLRQRLLRYPDSSVAGDEKPIVVLCSPQLNGGPLQDDIAYQLYKESAGELAYLSLRLNGELLNEHFFPWETEFAGTIPLTSCRGGENLLELRAVGVNGITADIVVARFTVPVIVDMTLTPDYVYGWAGDDSTVTLTATLRQECAWTASVPAVPAVAPQPGYGSAVQWSFSSADFADGSYQVRIDLPDLGLWRERSLLVDHQCGEVIAQITEAVTGVLKEGV